MSALSLRRVRLVALKCVKCMWKLTAKSFPHGRLAESARDMYDSKWVKSNAIGRLCELVSTMARVVRARDLRFFSCYVQV